MMVLARRTLEALRALTAAVQVLWALVFFAAAAWLVWAWEFGWLADVIGAAIAWVGINILRAGCEELLQNRAQQPQPQSRQRGRH